MANENDWPKSDIKYLKLDPRSKFVTLFEIPFKDDSDEEVRRVRALVSLARVVFVIWLGAFSEQPKPVVSELVPWRLENTGQNLLGRGFKDPQKAEGGRRSQNIKIGRSYGMHVRHAFFWMRHSKACTGYNYRPVQEAKGSRHQGQAHGKSNQVNGNAEQLDHGPPFFSFSTISISKSLRQTH